MKLKVVVPLHHSIIDVNTESASPRYTGVLRSVCTEHGPPAWAQPSLISRCLADPSPSSISDDCTQMCIEY